MKIRDRIGIFCARYITIIFEDGTSVKYNKKSDLTDEILDKTFVRMQTTGIFNDELKIWVQE